MATDTHKITGVVLAGGKAQRLGGMDKGLIQLAGRPMIEYVLESLVPQVDSILINANRNQELYNQFGYPVFSDSIGEFSGPLAGIYTALNTAETDLVLTAPCDGPWLPADLTQRLLKQLIAQKADICVAHDGERMQPVFGLFHKRVISDLKAYLEAGDRKFQLWLKQVNLALADFSDIPKAFINVNTEEERQRIEQAILASESS